MITKWLYVSQHEAPGVKMSRSPRRCRRLSSVLLFRSRPLRWKMRGDSTALLARVWRRSIARSKKGHGPDHVRPVAPSLDEREPVPARENRTSDETIAQSRATVRRVCPTTHLTRVSSSTLWPQGDCPTGCWTISSSFQASAKAHIFIRSAPVRSSITRSATAPSSPGGRRANIHHARRT